VDGPVRGEGVLHRFSAVDDAASAESNDGLLVVSFSLRLRLEFPESKVFGVVCFGFGGVSLPSFKLSSAI
jgi:hypothetical protein